MHLPPLAFGQRDALLQRDVERASEAIAQIVPSMRMTPIFPKREFYTKIASCTIGGVRLISSASAPCRMEVDDSLGWHLIVPYIGVASLSSERRTYALRSGVDALLMPNIRRSTERAPSSVAIASIDIDRLRATMATMAGRSGEGWQIAANPMPLRLARNRELFVSFLNLLQLIDTVHGQPGLGQILGVEDMLYRWIGATMLEIGQNEHGANVSSLDIVCDMIRNSPDRILTLTDMEEASGLSARSLQYAFRSRFGCSPMAWQRRERMMEAQRRLMNLQSQETITSVAHAMGFSSSAAFSTLYKKLFGEMPSETVRRYC